MSKVQSSTNILDLLISDILVSIDHIYIDIIIDDNTYASYHIIIHIHKLRILSDAPPSLKKVIASKELIHLRKSTKS